MNSLVENALAEIRTKQADLAASIAAVESRFKASQMIFIPETGLEIFAGEHYAGVVIGESGVASHHLILMAGEKESINWTDAVDWAKSIGGELPTRQEQALLYANLKSQFTENYYWSGERHKDERYAWYQYFHDGNQYGYNVYYTLRARAVRRSVI
jgi:hypothetical protein